MPQRNVAKVQHFRSATMQRRNNSATVQQFSDATLQRCK
jgi:hypothetical protein